MRGGHLGIGLQVSGLLVCNLLVCNLLGSGLLRSGLLGSVVDSRLGGLAARALAPAKEARSSLILAHRFLIPC